MWLFKAFLILLKRSYAIAKIIEIPIRATNVHNSATWREKERPISRTVFKDVRTMNVVSEKQRQAGSSGSAPATLQGNNLPPAAPNIFRNSLRGSKCNSLHYDYSCIPFTILPLIVVRIQHALEITDTDVSCRVHRNINKLRTRFLLIYTI